MVPIKPYTATVSLTGQIPTSGGLMSNPQVLSEPKTILCYFERVSPGEMYATWGVSLKDPAFIQCEVSDAKDFLPDAEVAVAGRVYRVEGMPEIHDAGNAADHADILLEFKRYNLQGT